VLSGWFVFLVLLVAILLVFSGLSTIICLQAKKSALHAKIVAFLGEAIIMSA